jgi:RNA polymerase sigma factor (sigma-70 family)
MVHEELEIRQPQSDAVARRRFSRRRGDEARGHDTRGLVAAAADGDQRAWNALVDRHARLVWAIARAHRLSAADAADISQMTWMRLVENLGRLRDPESIRGWIATTARRECLRVISERSRVEYRDELPEPDPRDCPDLDAGLLAAERDRTLWTAIGRLSERDQALLRLLSADPAPSYEVISELLEMPIGSIGPTRARCLERLRREIEALGVLSAA